MYMLHEYLLPSTLQTHRIIEVFFFLGGSVQLLCIAEPIIYLPPRHERENHSTEFDVLLTMHLSIILVINRLDNLTHKILFYNEFIICLYIEHYVLIIRRLKLYYTASGIIKPVGGLPLPRLRQDWLECIATSHTNRSLTTMNEIYIIWLNKKYQPHI